MWYYLVNNQRVGPVSAEQVKQLISTHVITPATLLWTEGMSTWTMANQTVFAAQFFSSTPPGTGGTPPPINGNPPPTGKGPAYGQPNVIMSGKYKLNFFQMAPDNQPFQPASTGERTLPVLITQATASSNGIQSYINTPYLTRMTSALKGTNLFKDAGASVGNFVLDNSQAHRISLSVVEYSHNNTARWFFFIIGWILIPIMLIYLLLKFKVEFSQKVVIEFDSASGKKSIFTAETSAMTQIGFFANANEADLVLSNTVTQMNINSLMNQMIKSKDTLGL
jgi:hypothetical protein